MDCRGDYAGCPLDTVCEAVLARYHVSCHRRLPRIRDELAAMATSRAAPSLAFLTEAFATLANRIEAHLAKEETLLFPAIKSLAAAERSGGGRPPLPFLTLLHPIRLMETEHAGIEAALDRLRDATRDLAVPQRLPSAWQRCLVDLEELDRDLREHHRFENEVLYPAALDLERRVL